jgi:MFS family permease
MQQGRFDEAEAVLKRLHTRKGEDRHDQAIKEFYQMRRQLEMDREMRQNTSMFEVFKTAPNRKRVLVAVILMWGNMFTGVLVLANYGIILFVQLGMTGYMPLLLLAILVTITFPGKVTTSLTIDRFGRRTFLLIGISGILVTLILECALEAVYLGTTNKAGQRAAVFFIFLFAIFWSTFIDATQYLYLSEIFPTHIRGQGVAVGMFSYFGAAIILLVAGPIALNKISWKFYYVLIIPTALYIVAIYL